KGKEVIFSEQIDKMVKDVGINGPQGRGPFVFHSVSGSVSVALSSICSRRLEYITASLGIASTPCLVSQQAGLPTEDVH
ncbi:MAG: hypothetical protein SV775_13575, partial [Thermodesulfobacteriota bacterium]|nr:hypothetical protein [Thermodesulfobacteriota bacterium]